MNKSLDKGAFVLSIDTELGEGTPRYPICRDIVDSLLELMENYEIRATWAILGYMIVDKDYINDPKTGSELTRGWTIQLSSEEQKERFQRELTYGSEVLERIRSISTFQEIACHTFSHINVKTIEKSDFENELMLCQSLTEPLGIKMNSIVYPWNAIQYLGSLIDFGYTNYRGLSNDWYMQYPVLLQRIARLLDHWFTISSPVAVPMNNGGIWNLPASYHYASGSGWRKMIPFSLRVNKVKKGIRTAIKRKGVFHLWFHPFDFVIEPQKWLNSLEQVFIEVNKYQKAGILNNYTMSELADCMEYKS